MFAPLFRFFLNCVVNFLCSMEKITTLSFLLIRVSVLFMHSFPLQKLLHVLRSQVTFLQNLFHCYPEAVMGLKDEWTQLEVKANALQQQALEQEMASQWRVRVCNLNFKVAKKCSFLWNRWMNLLC